MTPAGTRPPVAIVGFRRGKDHPRIFNIIGRRLHDHDGPRHGYQLVAPSQQISEASAALPVALTRFPNVVQNQGRALLRA